MLTHLYVSNFAIAELVETEFEPGMTVITGETGAGKSILLDAIGLSLGDRADARSVGPFSNKADICASFSINHNMPAQQWLDQRELLNDEDCVLRRVLSKDGKSKAFINNRPATLTDVRELGELLIDIHGQHAHQSLLKSQQQRKIVDTFGNHHTLCNRVKTAFQTLRDLQEQYNKLINNSAESEARADFLKFQLSEMQDIVINKQELAELESQLDVLSQAETIITHCDNAHQSIDADGAALSRLRQAMTDIESIPVKNQEIQDVLDMLESAFIQAQEAASNISHYLNTIDIDEAKLALLDEQLGAIYSLARKHRIEAKDLCDLQLELQQELELIDNSDEKQTQLLHELNAARDSYTDYAKSLTTARQNTVTQLKIAIEKRLTALSMANCKIEFSLEPCEPSPYGLEKVVLNISTNPGQKPQALAKIASGGELSRIGLAIQVVTAQSNKTPAMIFDEVDSGVGGAVAEVVGNLMRELSEKAQIFCVTHLPQVASKARHHFQVSKSGLANEPIKTHFTLLNNNERVDEVARMLGGLKISEQTIAHAKEMLNT